MQRPPVLAAVIAVGDVAPPVAHAAPTPIPAWFRYYQNCKAGRGGGPALWGEPVLASTTATTAPPVKSFPDLL